MSTMCKMCSNLCAYFHTACLGFPVSGIRHFLFDTAPCFFLDLSQYDFSTSTVAQYVILRYVKGECVCTHILVFSTC